MRPRRKTPARASNLKKSPGGGTSGGGGENWSRLVVLFLAAGLLFWAVAFRGEKGSFLGLGRGGTVPAAGGSAVDLGADAASDDGDSSDSGADDAPTVVAGNGRSGAAKIDATTGTLVLSPAGENDTSSADAGELLATTSSKPLHEKRHEEEENAAAAEAASAAAAVAATSTASHASAAAARRRRRRKLHPPARLSPVNGSYPFLWKRPKHRILHVNLDRVAMRRVYLDASRFGGDGLSEVDPEFSTETKGQECPEFEYSYEGFKGIASCWRDPIEDHARQPPKYPDNCPKMDKGCINATDELPHEKWAAQVLLLHNVYINVAGQVFNRTHFFDHNGCAVDQSFSYSAGSTKVIKYKSLVSLVDWYGWNARTILLDILPRFVTMDLVLPLIKNVPVAFGHRANHNRNQMEQMVALGFYDLLGVRLERLSPQILSGDDLFFADRLILPLHQRCGRPSRAMWKFIRNRHFLPSQGLPLYRHNFHSTYRKRHVPEDVSPGADWIALIGVKDEGTRKALVESLKLYNQLLKYLPSSKVQYYREGTLSFADRKKLLNRARLLVSTHENLLADMVFMPPGGTIFELRAVEEPDPTYHHLAEVCGLEYHLLFVEGRKSGGRGRLRVNDPTPIYKQLRVIAKRLMRSEHT